MQVRHQAAGAMDERRWLIGSTTSPEPRAGRRSGKPAGHPAGRGTGCRAHDNPLLGGIARAGRCSTWRGTLAVDSLLIQRQAIIDSISDCSRRNTGGTDGTGRAFMGSSVLKRAEPSRVVCGYDTATRYERAAKMSRTVDWEIPGEIQPKQADCPFDLDNALSAV